jgi:2-desacetyl-2-hydroxyethyl bacteriochlorophyllide A dehydrogenase
MKALIVTADHRLELQNISQPTPGPFEALVKILACGICSTTDSELIRGTQPNHSEYPCLLGHEAIGEIVQIGSKVKNFKPGDWVTRPAGLLPGTTRDGLTSAWGGFTEYGLVTDHKAMVDSGDNTLINDYTALRQNVLTEGPEIGLPASVLSIALAETLDWSEKLEMANKTVCVNGTGIAGLSLTLWAKLAGASKVIALGRRTERLALAKELGADAIVNISNSTGLNEVRELSGGGVDVFVEATGVASQMEVAIRSLRPGGTVGVYGVAPDNMYNLDWRWFPADIRFMMHEPREHLARARVVSLIKEGKIPVEKLMTHTWPFGSFQQAFEAAQRGEVVKSMLIMP